MCAVWLAAAWVISTGTAASPRIWIATIPIPVSPKYPVSAEAASCVR